MFKIHVQYLLFFEARGESLNPMTEYNVSMTQITA